MMSLVQPLSGYVLRSCSSLLVQTQARLRSLDGTSGTSALEYCVLEYRFQSVLARLHNGPLQLPTFCEPGLNKSVVVVHYAFRCRTGTTCTYKKALSYIAKNMALPSSGIDTVQNTKVQAEIHTQSLLSRLRRPLRYWVFSDPFWSGETIIIQLQNTRLMLSNVACYWVSNYPIDS